MRCVCLTGVAMRAVRESKMGLSARSEIPLTVPERELCRCECDAYGGDYVFAWRAQGCGWLCALCHVVAMCVVPRCLRDNSAQPEGGVRARVRVRGTGL